MKLLTVIEAAAYLGVHRGTVYRLIQRGLLKARPIIVGRGGRIKESDLRRLRGRVNE